MLKRTYYYLIAGLQDITLDIHKLSMDQLEFREELKNALHPVDYNWMKVLFYPHDNKNLLNLLQKNEKPFDPKGVFSLEQWEENLKEPTGELPSYMNDFILAFQDNEPIYQGMSSENQLTTLFYKFTQSLEQTFLNDWFLFNRDLNNLLTAISCRKYDIPYENQIIGDDEISETIKKSHARDFGLATEVSYIDDIINITKNEDIQDREKAVDKLKWDYLEDVTFFEYFTIDRVLAFVIKLGMVERWLAIDNEYGSKMFKQLLQELKASYKLPESFTAK